MRIENGGYVKEGQDYCWKKRHAPPVPSPAPLIVSAAISRFPVTLSHDNFIRICATRKVLVGRIFYENYLAGLNFRYLEKLSQWKWWNLITLKGDVMVNVMRAFYFLGDCQRYDSEGNMLDGEYNDRFKATVLGEEFDVHNDGLGGFLARLYLRMANRVCQETLIWLDLVR